MFQVVSLGCFRNTFDSEQYLTRVRNKDPRLFHGKRKVVFINTCGFVSDAKQESLEAIAEACRQKQEGKVDTLIVGGCLVRRYRKYLQKEYTDVDAFVDIEGIKNIQPRTCFLEKKPSVFLKISEGCHWKCSYCAIPLIKGPYQSRPESEIIDEVRSLDGQGFKELVIIAQDTSSWRDPKGSDDLTRLAEKILKHTRMIQWIRFLYFHPATLSRSMIDLIAREPRLCKYIDLPIQHINKRILRLMKREQTREPILKHLAYIRSLSEKIAVRTTVIVGFPTETQKEFDELHDFITEYRFDHLGAFQYSREEGTEACAFRQAPEKIKKQRFARIMKTQKKISESHLMGFVGKSILTLIEGTTDKDVYQGRTQYMAPEVDGQVWVHTKKKNIRGKIIPVTMTNSLEYDMEGVYA